MVQSLERNTLSRNLAAMLILIWDGINKIINVICKIFFQVTLNAWIPGSVGIIPGIVNT